ncbi:MAG TPA: S41 family peptidase [Candidatus Cybelea sp.]|jgi:carboxyl-terminal processing protease|nr:S41 family peptidase [Candidatus Cybelea sp.]
MKPFSELVGRTVALCALFALCVGAAPTAQALPYQVAGDVTESFQLLTATYYDTVDPQALLAAAADALSDAAHKHGVTIAPPALKVQGDRDATIAALNTAIVSAANSAHASPSDFAYAAIAGMAKATNDRYTQFFTPTEFKAFNEALDPEKISGIGVMIEPDQTSGCVRITYVLPATPAERAGVQVGDVITAVDGKPTKGLSVDMVSGRLRGKAGSVVAVSLLRGTAPSVASITREDVQPPTVVFKMLDNGIGYIWVMEFGRATPAEFDTAVSRLNGLGAKALVLDLRNDGGGYVNSALDISSRFIANKALLTVEERGKRATTIDADNDPSINLPVTVLVNQYTASASEITAGALQDDGIGMLVGAKTFGKGVMQTLTPLPDGAAIKITTAHYLTPSKRDINLRGIDPDVRVDENHDARFGDVATDAQLRAAIALLQKKIATNKT